jgi:threonine/homoserine/homoserine lactone efflux protein
LGFGALFWAVAALFGLALLFQIAPAVLWGFKIAGGLFLMWIALQMWRHAAEPPPDAAAAHARSPLSALRLGVVTQLANPKPAVFFGAVFIGTVPPHASALSVGLLLLASFVNEFVCNVVVARLFSYARIRAAYTRLKSTIDRSFGAVLGLLGLKIAAT